MKKLLLTLSALTLCLGLGLEARIFGDNCGSCKTNCKKERSCSTGCKKECKPCVKKECFSCERPCRRKERQEVKVVVPCPRYVEVMDYKIDTVLQEREICEPVAAKVGKWSCCDENRSKGRGCGDCDACHSAGVERDPETGILTNHPLYAKAKNDPQLAAKIKQVEEENREHGVQAEGTVPGSFDDEQNAAKEKATNEKSAKKMNKKAKKNKKAARNNKNTEVVEELEIEEA